MSDGANVIDCHDRDGRSIRVMVLLTPTQIEIGGWTFDREKLLFAIDAPRPMPRTPDP